MDHKLPISNFYGPQHQVESCYGPGDRNLYITEEEAVEILKMFSSFTKEQRIKNAFILREGCKRYSEVYSSRMLVRHSLVSDIRITDYGSSNSEVIREIKQLRSDLGLTERMELNLKSDDCLNDIRYKNKQVFYAKLNNTLTTPTENLPCMINEPDPILKRLVELRLGWYGEG
jgi:hypothetical protein